MKTLTKLTLAFTTQLVVGLGYNLKKEMKWQ